MPRIAWDHVHLRSPDPGAAAGFYVEMLDAAVTARAEDGERLRVTLDLGGNTVFIDRAAPDTPAPPEPPFLGLEHIGLAVTGIDEMVAELKAKGVRFTGEVTSPRPGVRIAFLRGPDGVTVELLERAAG